MLISGESFFITQSPFRQPVSWLPSRNVEPLQRSQPYRGDKSYATELVVCPMFLCRTSRRRCGRICPFGLPRTHYIFCTETDYSFRRTWCSCADGECHGRNRLHGSILSFRM